MASCASRHRHRELPCIALNAKGCGEAEESHLSDLPPHDKITECFGHASCLQRHCSALCRCAASRHTCCGFRGVRFVIRFPRGVVVSGSLESAPGWRHGVVYRGADADIGAESDSWPPSNDSYGAHQPIKGGCEASPSHASCRKCTSAAAHPLTYASSITVSAKEPRRSDRDSSSTGPQDQP